MPTSPTGYWTFFCNPKIWEIDRFLRSGKEEESYQIIPHQKDWFQPGQMGVIRVGKDARTQAELASRSKLQPGIYALVEITSFPTLRKESDLTYYLDPTAAAADETYRVDFRIISNLIEQPIPLKDLKENPTVADDPYLISGFQGASMPLLPEAFSELKHLADDTIRTKPVLHKEQGAALVWEALVEAAQREETLTYKEVGDRIDNNHRTIQRYLEPIHDYCLDKNLPPLSILVINQHTHQPGEGFVNARWGIASFAEGKNKVFEFDWTEVPNPFSPPAQAGINVSFDSLNIDQEYDRPKLASIWGYRGFQAISRGVVTPAGTNYIILFVTKEKQQALTQYQDELIGNSLHWEGEAKHTADNRIIASQQSKDQIFVFYRERHHSPFLFKGEARLIEYERRVDEPSKFLFQLASKPSAFTIIEDLQQDTQTKGLDQTEKETVIKSRIGQGLFRERLLAHWKGCAVTGLAVPELLRASHVKPWRDCTNEERLDVHNGLLLIPSLDHLFDGGWISFDEEGEILISQHLSTAAKSAFGVNEKIRLRQITDKLTSYLEYHRKFVYFY